MSVLVFWEHVQTIGIFPPAAYGWEPIGERRSQVHGLLMRSSLEVNMEYCCRTTRGNNGITFEAIHGTDAACCRLLRACEAAAVGTRRKATSGCAAQGDERPRAPPAPSKRRACKYRRDAEPRILRRCSLPAMTPGTGPLLPRGRGVLTLLRATPRSSPSPLRPCPCPYPCPCPARSTTGLLIWRAP